MGYYIFLEESTAVLPKGHQAEAYRRLCALNDDTPDDKKHGGCRHPDGSREAWFSWMDPNYPETCADAKAILMDLGFFFEETEDGDLLFSEYDSKMGQESEFLRCIGDLLTGEMVWRGEEHNLWRYTFGDRMRVHEPVQHALEWDQVPFFTDERDAAGNLKSWR